MQNKIALVFPGQGSQSVGMGKDLYENYAVARDVFKKVDDVLGVALSKIMFEGPADELTKTENTQPALMAVSIAIIEILAKEYGKKIEDLCVMTAGHSLGEYSALCAAGALSLEDTAKLLQIRGQAMARCGAKTKGAMAAVLGVEISVAQEIAAEAALGEVCQVANDNSVGQIVLSGTKTAIERSLEIAKAKGAKRAIMLPVSGAFHSALMLDAAQEMQKALATINLIMPRVALIANVTAQKIIDTSQIKDLLVQQITGSVRWRETMLFMAANGIEEIIEIGSGKVLSGLIGRTCAGVKSRSIQNVDDIKEFLK